MVRASSQFESVKSRLVGLTGSVEKAEVAFSKFNQVAATTPFTLDDVVNAGAQLEAFGADSQALLKEITDLAAFMGTSATEAANAFGRAFAGGAGAADILPGFVQGGNLAVGMGWQGTSVSNGSDVTPEQHNYRLCGAQRHGTIAAVQ